VRIGPVRLLAFRLCRRLYMERMKREGKTQTYAGNLNVLAILIEGVPIGMGYANDFQTSSPGELRHSRVTNPHASTQG
jgi:hypothetical protein